MANDLGRMAWKIRIPTGRKIVLLALADMADKDGSCWPSRELLAELTALSAASVSKHLKDLIDSGIVEQTRRRQKSATYRVIRGALLAAQDVQNQDVKEQDIENLDIENLNDSENDVKTSGIQTSLKGNPQEPPLSSEKPAEAENPEARKLCERLAELMTANGCKPPTITTKWLTSARLLLTKDGRDFADALAVLDWCQADDFWQDNIHSLPTFREQFDKLRGKAHKAGGLAPVVRAPKTVDGLTVWLRTQWQGATVGEIQAATGLRYEHPDIPLDVDTEAQRIEFFEHHRRAWITEHHQHIIDTLTGGQVA